LVPNPANPQSFNRYSYVRNNPLKYKDPTGRYECLANNICIDAITTLPPSPLPKPPAPLIKFDGFDGHTWTAAERTAVNSGAWQVARALYQASNGMFSSAREAFLSIFGGSVTFYKTGVTASNLGEATGKRKILVNNQANGGRITGPSHGTFWVAHELGHAFNYALSPNRTEPRFTLGQGLIDLAQKGVRVDGALISGAISSTSWLGDYTRGDFRGYQSSSFPHIQNPLSTASEDFADMFSNYVHNSFYPNNYGQERYDFMASHMRSWIALAVSNNE
jgi:hypothetical protein